MKIVTWNINSLRLRLGLLKTLVQDHMPDVIALQETKVRDELFPLEELNELGYKYCCFSGEKSYNGVAILSKLLIEKSFSLKFYNEDKRHVAAVIQGLEIHNFYIPAGGDIPDVSLNPKFKHKLEFLELIKSWLLQNRSLDHKLVICGDLNIAPHEHDVWSSQKLKKVVSHTEIERVKLLDLQNSLGFIDSARALIPFDQKIYTWWTYRVPDWQAFDRGRRLDHIWLSQNLKEKLIKVDSLKVARSWTQPSDHVPYIVTLEGEI